MFDGFQNDTDQVGRLIFKSKDSYLGFMKNWKLNGNGQFVEFSTGKIYDGEWKDNKLITSSNRTVEGFEVK